jgi:hypothetical protein
MKVCKNCGIEKDLDLFYKKHCFCKECTKQDRKKYRQNNKEKVAETQKLYQQKNKEKIRNQKKIRYDLKRDCILLQKKEYHKKNKEAICLKKREYFKSNKEKINAYRLNYQQNRTKNDSLFRFKRNVRALIHHSFKRNSNIFNKNSKTFEILGCTIEDFRTYIQSKFKKGMNFDNHGNWHLDHIIPLSTALTEDDVIRLNHYTNFQPLWAEENLSKFDKIIEQQLVLL